MEMNFTERELEIIRSALCDKSMKQLMLVHEVQQECREKGLEDNTSYIYMDIRQEIHSIIDTIDTTMEANKETYK